MNYVRLDRNEFLRLIPQIAVLHHRCFGGTISEDYFRWWYLDHPGKEIFIYVAMDETRLAAYYAVSPIVLSYNGQQKKAVISVNTMTDPDYAGQGLFPKLAQMLYRELMADGYCAVIVFPNVHSNRLYSRKLGFETVREIPMLELPLSGNFHESIEFDDRFLLAYEPHQSERIFVVKDPEYLRWRYHASTQADYRTIVVRGGGCVQAWAVCKVYKDRLNMVEFHAADEERADALLRRCMTYGRQCGCDYITVWAPINTELHMFFERWKFTNRYPVHYFSVKPLGAWAYADFLDARKWELQMGDNNTY